MKRAVLVVITLCLSLYIGAQSILGIPFGSSYQTTKECLESRFGSHKVVEDGGKLVALEPVVGGHEFKSGEFYFQRRGQDSWLNEVFFQIWFNTTETETAKYMRDQIAETLEEKYDVKTIINDQGFKVYVFGTNPKDPDDALGSLYISKSKGNDGKLRLYLILYYGPIYYISRASDF